MPLDKYTCFYKCQSLLRLLFSKNFSRVMFEHLHSGSDLTDKLIFYKTALYCKLKKNTKMIPNQNIHVSQFSITMTKPEIITMREKKAHFSPWFQNFPSTKVYPHVFGLYYIVTWVWNRGDLFTLWWAEDKDGRRSLSFIINFKCSVLIIPLPPTGSHLLKIVPHSTDYY